MSDKQRTQSGGTNRGRGRGAPQQQQQPRAQTQPQQQQPRPQTAGPQQQPRPQTSAPQQQPRPQTPGPQQQPRAQAQAQPVQPAPVQAPTQTPWGRPRAPVPEQQRPISAPQAQQPVRGAWTRPVAQQTPQSPIQPPVQQPVQPPIQQPIQPPVQQPIQSTIEAITEEPTEEPQVVQKLQDLTVAETAMFPPKPKEKCALGTPIQLFTNHYGFMVKNAYCLHQYDVKVFSTYLDPKTKKPVEKDLKERDTAKEIFANLINVVFKAHSNKIITDFRKNLYASVELPKPLNHKITIKGKEYCINLTKTTFINVDPKKPIDQTVINALQLSFTHNFTLNTRTNLGWNTDLWKGFFVSVRPSEMGFNVNIDVANTVFFNEGKLIDVACQFYNCNEDRLLQAMNNDRDGNFEWNLKNRKIKTHLGYTKKVEGFGPSAAKHQFTVDGKKTTVQAYFASQKIHLRHPQLPCLHLGKENYTPMELCSTVRTQISKLEPRQQSDMIKQTAVNPDVRKKDIETIMKSLDLNVDPILQQYNIQVELKMIDLNGRVLAAPDLEYGQNGLLSSKEIGNQGSWRNTGRKFFSINFKVTNWLVINYSQRTQANAINEFLSALIRVAKIHGIEMSNPSMTENFRPDRDPNKVVLSIEAAYKQYNSPTLILAILPGTTDVYKALKTFGDLKYGVSTQAIDGNTIFKSSGRGFDQLVSNICLKINPKLGGTNFRLSPRAASFQQILQKYNDGKVMVFGADVNHTTGNEAESIAALVGSIDSNFTYYAARLYAQRQPRGQALEIIFDLGKMVSSLLDEHYKVNKRFPERILFFRDGVSEGQFSKCLNHEMNEIRKACQEKSTACKPTVTFVVVQKRHHTRFFAANQKDMTRTGNVPPGTLVDVKIVTPDMFDFFLCSHNGIKGTSKPCHYFVLHDENNFTMNQMSLFSHYLCHIYSRSTTSVSYPAPTYYADLCAARGRDYLRQGKTGPCRQIESTEIVLHEKFRNKMFFI